LEFTIKDADPDISFFGPAMSGLEVLFINADDYNSGNPYQVLDLTPIGNLPRLSSLELRGFILKNVAALDEAESLTLNGIYVRGCVLNDASEKLDESAFYYDGR
jgi:hypothetical protein